MYDFQADLDERDHEIRLGLGHIRMIYSKNNSEARKILNAPLIEVPVKIDHDSLKVVPVKGGRLKWNGEAKNALLHTGAKSKNKRILAEFLAMLGNGDPTKILLGDPKTFLKYVEAASQFRFFSIVKNPTDPDLHQFPEGVEDKLVLTTEWCLFVRPKRSNSISNDALAFSNAFEETSLDLSLPCRSLLLGSSASHCKNDAFGNSNFDLPLPASQNQLEIIKHVFSENNFVTLIRGPPGTGKTQTGLNIASIILQRGGNCLITSDNPRALEAFAQKLPEELSSFCINMSAIQEDGIGKLSEALDSTENELLARYGEKDHYKENIKKLKEDIATMEQGRKDQHDQLITRNSTSRDLMEKLEFRNLVIHGLQGGNDICPHIKHILKHRDLCGLKDDLEILSDDQRAEDQEPIRFEYKSSEPITHSMIAHAEKKARPTDKPPDLIPCCAPIESYKLGDTGECVPETLEDWARVARGLKVKKRESDFREKHAKFLIETGCPETLIYERDDVVCHKFVYTVTDLWKSREGVRPEDLEKLLLFLEDTRMNRKIQKSQRDFSIRIQKLNVQLVHATAACSENNSITDRDLGNFSQLKELASRMKESEIDASRASAATLRRQRALRNKLQKSLSCMRLLLMTTDQDEASQSPSSTALTILARAETAVIIRDTKQILPTDDLGEESRSALEKCQGELDLADLFMPGDGNNLFDLCLSKFSVNQKLLRDHFRCPGDALSWQNTRMYANGMVFVMPSQKKSAQEIKYFNDADEVKRQMVQYLHDVVERELSLSIDAHTVPTLGIIMMGKKKDDVKIVKGMIEEKLTALEYKYGTEAVDRFLIKVAAPGEFQGQERDIILIGCLPENKKAPRENTPLHKRMWNTATSRFQKKSIIFSGYSRDQIKKDDPKYGIFMYYERSQESSSVGYVKKEAHDIRSMAENKIIDELKSCGYEVCRNKASLWKNSLSIELKDGTTSDPMALITIENYGETLQEWRKVVDQQADLEAARVACLRVDALALSLCSEAVLADMKAFLTEEATLLPTTDMRDEELNACCNPDSKQPASTGQRKRPATRTSKKSAKRGKNW